MNWFYYPHRANPSTKPHTVGVRVVLDIDNTRADFINFVNDIAKLRHIEFEFKEPEHIESNLGVASSTLPKKINPVQKFVELKREQKQERKQEIERKKQEIDNCNHLDWRKKNAAKRWIENTNGRYNLQTYVKFVETIEEYYKNQLSDAWQFRSKRCKKELAGVWRSYSNIEQDNTPYWDKNYWVHPDERFYPREKFVVKRSRSRRIRVSIEYKPFDAVAYVDKYAHHCHRYDSHPKAFGCCGVSQELSAQFNCTVELPHIHYKRFKRIVHPGKTVHEYDEAYDTIVKTDEIYNFVDGFYHKVSMPKTKVTTKQYQEDKL